MKWFRAYHELIEDAKFLMMSESEQLLWIKTLCLASRDSKRGFVTLSDDEICFTLRVSFEAWKCAKDKFRAKGFIQPIEGGFEITHWQDRQFDSDDHTARRKRAKSPSTKAPKDKSVSPDHTGDHPISDHPITHLADPAITQTIALDKKRRDPDPDPEKDSLSLRRFSHSHENLEPEEREVSHSLKEPEAIATAPDYAQAKSNFVKTPNPVENHFPASPPAPVGKSVEKVLPPWRLSWAVDDYDRGFCGDVLRRLQKQWPERVMGDAIAKIYNAERLGKHNQLEADYSSYLNRQNAAPPPLPSALNRSEKLSDAREVGLPQDLSEAIAAIQTKLSTLSWSNQDAARWMKYSGRWTCERGATKALLDGKGAGFARLADDEILMLLDTLSPLNPGQCIPTLQAA